MFKKQVCRSLELIPTLKFVRYERQRHKRRMEKVSSVMTIPRVYLPVDYTDNMASFGNPNYKTGGNCGDITLGFRFFGDELIELKKGDEEHCFVQGRFYSGLGFLMSYTGVVSIHKISHSSFSGQARLQAFSLYSDAIAKKCGGDANIRYAWHGSGKDGVSQVILHGFGLCNRPEGKGANGVGIYLSPEGSSIDSLVYSNVDDDGQQHMLLCRVIMGNMELVPTGSEQFHPSSEEFDSGVDNPITPSRYIVWSTHMNTHILPEYVVSFKVSHPHLTKLLSLRNWKADSMESLIASNPHVFGNSPGKWMQLQQKKPAKVPFVVAHHVKGESAARKPSSAWMPFPRLISVLAGILPPSSISLIEKYHTSYLEKRITRECMIKKVRQIAGDKVLVAAIKSYRSKQLKELAHQRTPFPRQSNSTDPGSCTSENTISTADSRTH